MDWKPEWLIEIEQTWEQVKYYKNVVWDWIIFIFWDFPKMIAGFVQTVANIIPFNDIAPPAILPFVALVYVMIMFFRTSRGKRGIIASSLFTGLLTYTMFTPIAFGGLYPPIILIFATAFIYHKKEAIWFWDRIRGVSSTSFDALKGATLITSAGVKELGSAAKYGGDPAAKYCSASFGKLMEAFETEPELLKHGELDKPAFLAAMAEIVEQLMKEFEHHTATIESVATDIENGLQSAIVEMQAGAQVSKEFLRRLTP